MTESVSKKGRHGTVGPRAEKIVWARAAGRCQICNDSLIGHLVSGSRTANKGYIAHIIGSSDDGPRGNADQSKALAKDPDNVMLLCDGCHRVIDRDERDKHPEPVLRRMKATHEGWISRSVGLRPASQSHILRFTNQIAANETAIPVDICIAAMQAIGRTPASFDPIDLKLGIPGQKDDGELFWAVEPDDLVQFFQERIKGRINSGQYRHISVFGFAPMPLLMKLGQLLPDIHDVEIFTRHREPEPSWIWREGASEMGSRLIEGTPDGKMVALKLSVTDRISDDRVMSAMPDVPLSIWEITCSSPRHDALRTREDMSQFREVVRSAFNRVKEVHGEDAEVFVFPAAPAACCIEFGRCWQPKTHRPMEIFDQVQDRGFVRRLRIE